MALDTTQPAVREELAELALLFEVSQALEQSVDLRDVVTPVLQAIAKHSAMQRCMLTLFKKDTGDIWIDAAEGLSPRQRQKGRYKLGEGIIGRVVQTGKALVVPRISEEPLFLDRTGARENLRKQDISYVCVPIKLGNEVIGTLSADQPFAGQASLSEDARLLSVVATLVAQAVKLRLSIEEQRKALVDENIRLHEELRDRFRPSNIIGNSRVMHAVYDQIAQVCKSDATVLVLGESGTGKELVAQAIHYNSLRADKPFVKVNCAALPETILESELFGHEKGAFTGALSARKGRFELAAGGTIFLDEVGDFSPATQIRLLRVIQEREFEHVGGTETIKADVRIIAATNRDLLKLIDEGSFREDLYYRLNVFPIHLPPLRERKTDIPLLADHFVGKYSALNHRDIRRISTPAIDMLMSYHWPGNVRELENCIERAVLVSNDNVIHGHHLPPTLQTAEASGTGASGSLQDQLDNLERDVITDALKSARGNAAKAAQILGITERIMGLRLKKFSIDYRRFRPQRQRRAAGAQDDGI